MRKFRMNHHLMMNDEWWFGVGTRYQPGDYMIDGKVKDRSIYTLHDCLYNRDMVEIPQIDPDLVVMEGL